MFKKQFRLTRDKEFEKVFKIGRSNYNQFLGIKTAKNEIGVNRFGIIVSTKVSKKAVERNKIKRRLREILKNYHEKLFCSLDIVIITLPKSKEASFKELDKAVFFSLNKLKLLK